MNHERLSAWALAFALGVVCLPTESVAETLAVQSSSAWAGAPGHQVVVDFTTDGLTAGLSFELAVADGLVLSDQSPVVSIPHALVACRQPAPGRVKCLVHSPVNTSGLGAGTVTLACDVPQAPGSYPVTIVSANAYDQSSMPRSTSASNGVITVQGLPVISVGAASVVEGNSGIVQASFPISLSSASVAPVSFVVSTRPGTATPGVDFTAVDTLPVTLPAGTTSVTVNVDIHGDLVTEPNETFALALSKVQGAVGEGAQARGVIVDDDRPQLRVGDVTVVEGDTGVTTAVFEVSLSRWSSSPVTFNFSTESGTALAGSDFKVVSGTGRLIDAGRSRAVIEVQVLGDTSPEGPESFVLNVSAVSGADVIDGSGVATITDDDVAATGSIIQIGTVQGVGAASPLVGSFVEVRGVVTGVAAAGFFVQSQDSQGDGNPLSPEGLFVRSSVAPPEIGDLVRVMGRVEEFATDSAALRATQTELAEASRVVERAGVPLPRAVELALSPSAWKRTDSLEELEGMRVTVAGLSVVGPSGARRNIRTGRMQPTGRAYAVGPGVARTFQSNGPNPERLLIGSDFLGAPELALANVGDSLAPVHAVVGVEAGHYALWLERGHRPSAMGMSGVRGAPEPRPGQASVAYFVVSGGADEAADDGGLRVRRASKVARAICAMASAPDVVALSMRQRSPDAGVLVDVLNSDLPTVSGCTQGTRYSLASVSRSGSESLAVLLKTASPGEPSRASRILAVKAMGAAATFRDQDGRVQPLFATAPRWLTLKVSGSSGKSLTMDLLIRWDRSPAGFSRGLRRKAQDAFLASSVRPRLGSPSATTIVLGDRDDWDVASSQVFSTTLVDVTAGLRATQRYSAVESGDAVMRDIVLVSGTVADRLKPTVHPVRINADFGEELQDDLELPIRISDRDPMVLLLDLE